MKKQAFQVTIIISAITLAFAACKKKPTPVPDEQELITTMKLIVTDTAGNSQTFIYKIENGFGTTTAGITQIDTVRLAANATYTVATELYNEKASPVENTTEEILREQDEHLFLYQSTPATGAGSIAFSSGSKDENNLPFNQAITFRTEAAGSGMLQINLMHQPTNKNGATPAASGGETDAEAMYPVRIQ